MGLGIAGEQGRVREWQVCVDMRQVCIVLEHCNEAAGCF